MASQTKSSEREAEAGGAAAGAAQLSVVVPLYNEAESLSAVVEELLGVLRPIGRSFEVILVDDGSTDGTAAVLADAAAEHPELRPLYLARNYGQSTAFQAGFDAAEGEVVVTLDGDLQNDPADIPALIELLESEDVDLVSGWRRDRQDGWLRVKLSQAANGLISRVTGVKLHDYGCSLKAYRRDVLQQIRVSGELHRFIPVLLAEVGGEVRELPVNHRARRYGHSKYSFDRTLRVSLDLLLLHFMRRYLQRPLHFFGSLGVISGGLGAFAFLILLFEKFVLGEDIGDRPLLIVSVTLMLGGLIFLTHGVLGEIMTRLLLSSSDSPQYRLKPARKRPKGAAKTRS